MNHAKLGANALNSERPRTMGISGSPERPSLQSGNVPDLCDQHVACSSGVAEVQQSPLEKKRKTLNSLNVILHKYKLYWTTPGMVSRTSGTFVSTQTRSCCSQLKGR